MSNPFICKGKRYDEGVSAAEIWRTVPGYRGYEVSDLGNVRSVDRAVPGKYTNGGKRSTRVIAGKVLTPRIWPNGTACVNLWRGNAYNQVPIRRLMMMTFVGPRPKGMDAVNKDGNVKNNRLGNLTWARTAPPVCPTCGGRLPSKGTESANADQEIPEEALPT